VDGVADGGDLGAPRQADVDFVDTGIEKFQAEQAAQGRANDEMVDQSAVFFAERLHGLGFAMGNVGDASVAVRDSARSSGSVGESSALRRGTPGAPRLASPGPPRHNLAAPGGPGTERTEKIEMYQELRDVWQELTGPGGPFEIRSAEVLGHEVPTYTSAPPSLRELWLASAGHGDRDYLVYADERWTYEAAHRDVAAIASWLVAQGVAPGDRVAIAMRNYPEWMLVYWAALSVGAAVVGMNAWWVGAEMVYGLQDSRPKVLVCDSERLERFLPVRDEAPETIVVAVRVDGELPAGVLPFAALTEGGGELPDVRVDADSDACIFYTSGTTGRPKGAQLTHRGCVHNLLSLAFWNTAQTMAAMRAGRAKGAPADPGSLAALVVTPLFHVTANNCVAHAATAAGGKLVLMYKWEAGEALRLVEAERITNFSGVPTMARELVTHPDFPKRDTSSLKAVGGGGAQIQPDLVDKIEKSGAGRPSTGYGMTETCGIITANAAEFFLDKPESVGPAMPCFLAKCVDAEGNEVARGQVGELWVKGPQVIRGYLNRPEATAESITDGWLHTGDIARIDEDGFIFIVDRAKDMVLRGGENVYCAEVEAAIFEHPAVAECAVFGVPDDRLGEEVGAAVVLAAGATAGAEDLREHLASRLARYKVPRYIWFRSEALPRNASGKFLKRELRETLDPSAAA
jgi:long-chain acyl-CoA synthetase